ncbi:MAG: hypothetical protein Ct9H90mP13_05850 [Pseudomonadota bacterium]|nr:MAG: hypothetical protein Ct9H90mP13_05850 [Pseudomonadota bacterium]
MSLFPQPCPRPKKLRKTVEPLITLAKEDGVSRRRRAFDLLRDKKAVGKLFTEIGPKILKTDLADT